MKKLDWLHLVLIGIVAWLGFIVWIEPYRYLKLGQSPVRVSRITGATEKLYLEGWQLMVAAKKQTFRELRPDEAFEPLKETEPPIR